MKKFIILLLVTAIGFAVFLYWSQQMPPAPPQDEVPAVLTLSGKVVTAADVITIEANNGTRFLFDRSAVEAIFSGSILTGDSVTLSYTGLLQKNKLSPNATLLQIVISPPAKEPTPTFPKEWDDHGIFSAYYSKAYKMLQIMSLEEKVGQIFLSRCPLEKVQTVISTYHPGGFVLFARDFLGKTKEEVKSNLSTYQHSSSVPMLMAVDEEGGAVIRISQNPKLSALPFLSAQSLYRSGGMEKIKQDTVLKSRLLLSLGINVNLAPVCDVSVNTGDYMYKRAFGKPPKETAAYVETVVETMLKENISSVLKHFPGYGNNADTHTGLAIDQREYKTFLSEDFLPFQAGIKAGADALLVSHTIVTSMDKSKPASLSLPIHDILRKDLSFTGIIMTDDLAMDAIATYTKDDSPALTALKAGNDMIIMTDLKSGYESVFTAVKNKSLSIDLLDRAVFRILAWKYQKGLLTE